MYYFNTGQKKIKPEIWFRSMSGTLFVEFPDWLKSVVWPYHDVSNKYLLRYLIWKL